MMEYGNIDIMSQKDIDRLKSLIRNADSLKAGLLKEVTVAAEADGTVIFGHTVSDLQENVEVQGDSIVGTLKYTSTGALPDYWGPGYFLVLKFSDPDASATSVKVGLDPSVSSGLVELDQDMNASFKITDKGNQVLKVVSTDGTRSTVQNFDLSRLVLE